MQLTVVGLTLHIQQRVSVKVVQLRDTPTSQKSRFEVTLVTGNISFYRWMWILPTSLCVAVETREDGLKSEGISSEILNRF